MQVVYLHGFNSSHRSFAYIHAQLPAHSIFPLNYESHLPLDDSLEQIRRRLPRGRFGLVGHSLGGILAVLLAAEREADVDALVCLSAPFGGSRAAIGLRWLPGYPRVFHDITPSSPKIELIQRLKLAVPTLSIISTGGNLPMSPEANDSIVTLRSQRALPFGKKVEIRANHFEILLHERTVQLIQNQLFGGA